MVDRSKELYQQQLAQAAWANFGGAGGYNPAPAAHGSFAGGSSSMGAAGASTNPYENYMQRLSQFAGLSGGQHNSGMFGSNFLSNGGSKDMSSFTSPFGFPPGHPMHFPGLGNYNPLPAHSPLPAHMKNSSSGPSTPLPAHMRSSPYQPGSYHTPPYSYNMPPGYSGANQQHPGPGHGQYGEAADQVRRQAAAAAMHNGNANPMSSFLSQDVSSAYSHLQQQLTAAYSQAASAKDVSSSKKNNSVSAVTTNNNYPYSSHSLTTTASTSSSYSSHNNVSSNNWSNDQIAAALLNRFSGQFNQQLMSEMEKSSHSSHERSQIPSAVGYPPLSVPNLSSLASTKDAREKEGVSTPYRNSETAPKPSAEVKQPDSDSSKKLPPDRSGQPLAPDKSVPPTVSPVKHSSSNNLLEHGHQRTDFSNSRPEIPDLRSAVPSFKPEVTNSQPGMSPLEKNHNQIEEKDKNEDKNLMKSDGNQSLVNSSAVKTDLVENNHVNNSNIVDANFRQTPVSSAPMSITNKIKDLQSRQSSNSSKQQTASSLSKEDRSQLTGLWKMQAQLFQKKPVHKPKPASTQSLTPTVTTQSLTPTVTTPSLTQTVVTTSTISSTTSLTTSSTSIPSPTVNSTQKHFSSSSPVPQNPSPALPPSIPSTGVPGPALPSPGPPLIHTPRSPPHPPPPLPSPHPYSHHFDNKSQYYNPSKPYSSSSHNQPYYTPPPSTSYQPSYVPPQPSVPASSVPSTTPSLEQSRIPSLESSRTLSLESTKVPPLEATRVPSLGSSRIPSTDLSRIPSTESSRIPPTESSRNHKLTDAPLSSNQNERMEVKNSGIPGKDD